MNLKKLAVFDIDNTLSRNVLAIPIMRAEEESGLLAVGTMQKVTKLLVALKGAEITYETATQHLTYDNQA